MPSLSAARLTPIEVQPASRALPPFELFEHVGSSRAAAETFISQRFAESYGSRIEAFMPRLFSVRSPEGDICGAFGLRSAAAPQRRSRSR